jgi:hypothetical protein
MAIAVINTSWDDQAVQQEVEKAIQDGRARVRRSSMKLGPYNGFPGHIRAEADWKIKVAIDLGLVPAPTVCSVCGGSHGRMDYHAEDYSRPLRMAAICQSCHMALHNRLRSPGFAKSWQQRVQAHGDGTKWFERIA